MVMTLRSLIYHQGFMKYFKNTSWLLTEKILRIFVQLFVGVLLVRYLGPEEYGLYSYAGAFVGLFATIATLGLDAIVIRELVKNENKRDLLLGTAFLLKLTGAFVMLIILTLAFNFTSNDRYTNVLIFIIASATIFQSFNVIDFYFQSKVLSRFIVFANFISLFISSIVKILLILYEAPLIAFAYVILFDSFVLACGFLYFYFKNDLSFTLWKFDKVVAVSLLKDSWPLILSGIAISIYMRIDQVMIKEMLNTKAVGQYAAAVRLSQSWYFVPMIIASSLFPAIINAKRVSKELYYIRLQRLFNLLVWLSIAIALLMTYFSDFVVSILYGSKYNEAGDVLMIHVWGGVFAALGLGQSKYFLANNLQKQLFIITVISAILNVILNYILIPIWGINGAAIATLISFSIGTLITPLIFKEARIMMKMSYRSFIIYKGSL